MAGRAVFIGRGVRRLNLEKRDVLLIPQGYKFRTSRQAAQLSFNRKAGMAIGQFNMGINTLIALIDTPSLAA